MAFFSAVDHQVSSSQLCLEFPNRIR
jgi:hypothetical protein